MGKHKEVGCTLKMVTINADDFGLNKSCSRAIGYAFDMGLITDTTMITNTEYFDEAIKIAKTQGFADRLGIHFNLTDGKPITKEIKTCESFVNNGVFHCHNNLLKYLNNKEKFAVYEELTAQIEKLQNAGIKITHADSHHHIHTAIFIAPIVARVCKEHGISKVRLHRNIGKINAVKRFVKKMYNGWLQRQGFITTDYFGSLFDIENAEIPDNCEIMVHPDFDKNGILIDRNDEENGVPVGNKLPDLRSERNVTLRGYVEL